MLTMTVCLSACGGSSTPSSTTSTPLPSTSLQSASSSESRTSISSTAALAIVGQPQQSVSLGSIYYFNANTTGGISKSVTFSIKNKPDWITLNTLTGELNGTPETAGTFSNIIMSASDGQSTATMQPFSITVSDTSASNKVTATVSWTAPTSNTDGSAFDNPSGFVIHYGTNASALNQSVTVGSHTAISCNLTGLTKGSTYYFAVAAINAMNMEGELSAVTRITL